MFVKERFVLDQAIVELLNEQTPRFGYNGFGEAVYYRTYSRKICKACRTTDILWDGKDESCANCGYGFEIGQETWNDTVRRVTEGTFSIRKDWYVKNHIAWDESFWQHYSMHFALSLFQFKWMPPGRGLWAMGTPFVYNRGSAALQNCGWKLLGDNLGNDIEWLMDMLMVGIGVGFAPLRNDDMKIYEPHGSFEYVIPDSREGWVQATKILINSYIKKGLNKVKLVYDEVRPSGLPIRGFGGISSGPDPLIYFHEKIRQFFGMMGTPGYNSVMLKADIANACGACVVSGNVRRSAELMAGEIDDIIDLKNYDKYPYREEHGGLSNNSVYLRNDNDFERLHEIAERVKVNAEPGQLNMRNMPFGRIGKPMGSLRNDEASGLNPCRNWSSKVLSKNGLVNFGTLKPGDEIWSETGWTKVLKFWSTGLNQVNRYHTTAGVFEGTPNHHIVCSGFKCEIESASGIDILRGPYVANVKIDPQDVIDGIVLGDGSQEGDKIHLCIGEDDYDYFNSEVSTFIAANVSHPTYYEVATNIVSLPLTYNRVVPDTYLLGNRNKVCGFLRGLYSANGCVVATRVQLKASSLKVIEQVQMMLSSIGIKSYYTTNKPTMVNWKNGTYLSKQSYDLAIMDDREKFQATIGFVQGYKNEVLAESIKKIHSSKLGRRISKETFNVYMVEEVGVEETFDITVDNCLHTYWSDCFNVSNCGEMPLEDGELCCLADSCPSNCQDTEEWKKALEYATVYATSVTLLPTHNALTNAVMLRNRRIGIGMMDVCGWESKIGTSSLIKNLREGYQKVRDTASWTNNEAGIPLPIRFTTIKPNGTTAKLPGLRSGWQWPTFGHTLRRMRVAQNGPVYPIFHAAGIPHEPDIFSHNTEVFEFPVDQIGNSGIRPATEISLWRQAMMLVLLQREWADNAVSNTLYFRPAWPMVLDIEVDFYYPNLPTTITEILPMSWDVFLNIQEWENASHRIVLKQSKWNDTWRLRLYRYDPHHEEDDVEGVLAAIAPLTKSVSLLPHSQNGVYAQTPEEGISETEYNRRVAAIRPINWNVLAGSDGEDEKFCSGASCELPKRERL